jgi:hypothetical protein
VLFRLARQNPRRCTELFPGNLFVESFIHIILCDPRFRISALTKILLFCPVTHHTGMGNFQRFPGIFGIRNFILHATCSEVRMHERKRILVTTGWARAGNYLLCCAIAATGKAGLYPVGRALNLTLTRFPSI